MSGEVADEWASTTLKEAAGELFTDGDWVESKDQDPDGEVRLIQLADIGDGLFLDKSARFLTADKARELRCTFLRPGDLLIARMADPIARCCLFPGLDQPAATVVDVSIVRPGPDVDREYLAYAISAPAFRSEALGSASGTTRSRISRSNLGAISLPLPPLDEQRRIAVVLRSVDEAIAATQATVQTGAEVRQVTLDAMVQRVLDDPVTEVRPLSDIAEVRTGLAKNKNRAGPKVHVPYLRVANVQDGWFDLADMQNIEVDPGQVDRYLLQAGDVLLTEGGDYDKLGRGGVWHGQITPCLHQNHVFCVRPDTSALLPDYFALATQSAWGRAYFLTCAKRTTNLASINSSQLRAFPVPVVPASTQAALIEQLAAIDAMIDLEERQLETLLRLRAEVSSDLLSGRVRVPA